MTRFVDLTRATCAALVLFAGASVASAQTEFFKGKTISLLIGFGVGGEDDLWARAISKHIGNHIPGNPLMVRRTRLARAGFWSRTALPIPRRRTAPSSA
jgi:tripartite-type tricarboxylate transporter receptor subunit TctC